VPVRPGRRPGPGESEALLVPLPQLTPRVYRDREVNGKEPAVDVLAATDRGLVLVNDGGTAHEVVAGGAIGVTPRWAVVDGSLRALPGGEPVAPIERWEPTCVAEAGGGALVGTAEAHLLRVGAGDGALEPVRSFDDAPERAAWYTPWGGPPDTRSIAVAPDGAVYVNVHVGGVLRSDDGDRAGWKPTLDIDVDVHQILVTPSGRLLVATGAAAFGWSDDRGASWSWLEDGFHGTYHRAVAAAGDTVLVTASTGPGSRHGAVYRVDPDRGAVERCTAGLPDRFEGNVDTGSLVASGDVAVVASPDGTLYRSDDAGRSWSLLAERIGAVRSLALA
jgi:hypothetical protein